jgi:hypothetical protein
MFVLYLAQIHIPRDNDTHVEIPFRLHFHILPSYVHLHHENHIFCIKTILKKKHVKKMLIYHRVQPNSS